MAIWSFYDLVKVENRKVRRKSGWSKSFLRRRQRPVPSTGEHVLFLMEHVCSVERSRGSAN